MQSEKRKVQSAKIKIFACLPARQGFWFAILIFAFWFLVSEGFAKPVSPAPVPVRTASSAELIEHAKEYDGKIVSFQGEVVGEVMRRGDFAWINVHDGQNALGIWAKSPLTSPITFTGNYKSTGDIIKIQGVFHRACLEHGGDLDIHADSITVIKPGQAKFEEASFRKKRLVKILAGLTLCLLTLRLLLKIWKKR